MQDSGHGYSSIVYSVAYYAEYFEQAYSPETGGRSFEENQTFFEDAKDHGTWRVQKVNKGEFRGMPKKEKEDQDGEATPLLGSG